MANQRPLRKRSNDQPSNRWAVPDVYRCHVLLHGWMSREQRFHEKRFHEKRYFSSYYAAVSTLLSMTIVCNWGPFRGTDKKLL